MQVLARANRERLAVLLGEAQRKDVASEERYAAALRHVPCAETLPSPLCVGPEKLPRPSSV